MGLYYNTSCKTYFIKYCNRLKCLSLLVTYTLIKHQTSMKTFCDKHSSFFAYSGRKKVLTMIVWVCTVKLLAVILHKVLQQARVFVTPCHIHLKLIFEGKALSTNLYETFSEANTLAFFCVKIKKKFYNYSNISLCNETFYRCNEFRTAVSQSVCLCLSHARQPNMYNQVQYGSPQPQ